MAAGKIGIRPIVHFFNEYVGVSRRGSLAEIARRIATHQKNTLGLDVKVVLRNSKGMNLEGFSNNVGGLWTKTIESVPVYVVGKGTSELYPNNAVEYEDFANGFLGYFHDARFGDVSIIHAHDYGMGIALKYIEDHNGDAFSSIFTMYDPNRFDAIFSAGSQPADLIQDGGLSGIKAGVQHADVSTVWGSAHYDYLVKGKYGEFLKKKGFEHFFNIETNWMSWKETGEISEPAIEAMSRAYLQALYGSHYDFSVNLKDRKLQPDNILVSVTERVPSIDPRGDIIKAGLEKGLNLSRDVIKVSSRGTGYTKAYTDNVGGLVHMFEHLFGPEKTYNREGIYYALLTGGVGERLMNVGLAASGIKGEVMAGHKTLNQIMIEQAPMIAAQLPNEGKGFVVISGNDNVMVPDGPITVGEHLLADSKQEIFLLAQPQRVANLPPGIDIDYLKELGVMIADKKTGLLKEFYEKKKIAIGTDKEKKEYFDVDFIKERLAQTEGGDSVFKNTFYFVMSLDIAKLFHEKYSEKTSKNGLPFHEAYGLDFSKKFIEATVVDKAPWMARYNAKDKYDLKDWEYLWDAAHEIVEEAGGIGVANIGENAIWSDVGTVDELFKLYSALISSDVRRKTLLRGIMNISDKNIDRSYVANVTTLTRESLQGKDDILIDHSVFANGGKIGKNCVIINSFFEEFAEIPSNTIVIGSHIYKIDNNPRRPLMNKNKLVYSVHKASNQTFWFVDEIAVASMIFHEVNGEIPLKTGEFPIFLTGKEKETNPNQTFKSDPIFNHYVYDGNMKEQPIRGIGMAPAPKDTKESYSLKNARKAYEDLMAKIDRELKKLGVITQITPQITP